MLTYVWINPVTDRDDGRETDWMNFSISTVSCGYIAGKTGETP